MLKSLTVLILVTGAVKRKENVTAKTKTSITKLEERRGQKGSQLCEECGHKIKHENWDAHFHYALHPNSELNILMKCYLTKLGNLRKEGKLNDEIQADIQAEYAKQKTEIRKLLNENLVDEEETPEPQPEPEKPKPDIDKVFNHVHQLLMNDEFLEDYFMLFGKHKDRIVIGIPVDNHKYKVVIAFKTVIDYDYIMITCYQVRRALSDYLIPKPYSYYRYFTREYHFHFLGLGISGWGIWVFLWGVGVWG